MAKVLTAFTDREYVTYDDEGNRSVVSEPFDDEGNLKEGVFAENVTYTAGDDYEGSDAPTGFVEDSTENAAPAPETTTKQRIN